MRSGLTSALGAALGRKGKIPLIDKRDVSQSRWRWRSRRSATDQHERHHPADAPGPVLGAAPSGLRCGGPGAGRPRTLDSRPGAGGGPGAHLQLVCATPAGFPSLAITGKLLAGWLVVDLDATLITAHSGKEGAAPPSSPGLAAIHWGFVADAAEGLAMLLRPGNAGSNTFADTPRSSPRRSSQIRRAGCSSELLVRVDGGNTEPRA